MKKFLASTRIRAQHWGMYVLTIGKVPSIYVIAIIALAVFTPDSAFAYDGGRFEQGCESIATMSIDLVGIH